MSVITIWKPFYWYEGFLKLATGVVSLVTAVLVWPLLKQALKLPSSAELKLVNATLQMEVDKRKEAEKIAIRAKEEAEEANLAKSIFLANMSHEIRTPLNAVLGYSQMLLRQSDMAANVKDAIKTIDTSGKNLLTMINEILDLSKIEAGKMELNVSAFDLKELLDHVSRLFEPRCKEKKLQWNAKGFDDSVVVYGDEVKLQQILINLLGNAVKFTDSGEIKFFVTPLKDNQYQFNIIDTGQGIPVQAQEKIFNAFQQDKAGEQKGGTGLGLAIAKKQLELMGSDLFLKSETDSGAEFYFTLTLPPAAKDTTVTRVSPIVDSRTILHLSPGQKVKALIVDDIENNRQLLSQMLMNIGAETVVAVNGKDGIEKVKEHQPDIIFMDMRMPVMNGEDAIQEIHKEFGKDRFKIVSLTADIIGKNRDYYLSIGCHEHMSKPIQDNEVYRCIGKLLNVDFVYENEDPPSQEEATEEKEFDPAQFYAPENLQSRLIQMAGLCNVTELEIILKEMEQTEEVSELLVEHLRELNKTYDFDEIIKVMERVPNTKG
ncbi:MAG: response regulator [Candidatus Nitrohelix vancouverensis]|uniref:histidine kinase n=1 Tax=Candidatus Nitrohelix vancouverensis TaxID=2705534 RepID=A0A7T0C0I8_9BACT|nr:MAG: response regulator [Candidatus Nitrohelix vancouverensis]